jgi:D-apiose dehydrogenase
MTGRHLTLGISGFGSIGRRHARVAAADGWRVVVFDPVPAADAEFADVPARPAFVDTFDALFGAGVDAVVVATPDAAHAAQAIACCERGIPVLVEKPLADTREGARAIEAASQSTGTPVLCGYVLRHSSALRAARKMLLAGQIGAPASFHVNLGAYETLEFARSRFGPADRDHLYVDYSHEWDYLCWLFGPVRRVCSAARTVHDLPLVQAPNVLDALIELESVTGSAHLDYVQRPGCRALSVVGTGGVLDVDFPAGTVTRRDLAGEVHVSRFSQERDELFRLQLANLAAVAGGSQPPLVTASDGVRAVQIAEALIESSRTSAWVRVSS